MEVVCRIGYSLPSLCDSKLEPSRNKVIGLLSFHNPFLSLNVVQDAH